MKVESHKNKGRDYLP